MVGDIVQIDDAEIEDLFPHKMLIDGAARLLFHRDDSFEEVLDTGRPIIAQIERYAVARDIRLPKGWKVDLAKRIKSHLLGVNSDLTEEATFIDRWKALFKRLDA